MSITTASIKSHIVDLSKLLSGKKLTQLEIQEKWNSLVGEKLKIKQIEIEIEDEPTPEIPKVETREPDLLKSQDQVESLRPELLKSKTSFLPGDKVKMFLKKGYYAAVIGKFNTKNYTVWTCKNSLSPTAIIHKYMCPVNFLQHITDGDNTLWNFQQRLTGDHINGLNTSRQKLQKSQETGVFQKSQSESQETRVFQKECPPSSIGYKTINSLHEYVKKWVIDRYARGYTTVSIKNNKEILVELEDLRHGDSMKLVLKTSDPVKDLVKSIQQTLPRVYGKTPGVTGDFDYEHSVIIKGDINQNIDV